MADTPLRHDDIDGAATTETAGAADSHADDTEYLAIVVPYDDAPDECTILPDGVPEAELMTTWISAQAGSFVSLAEMA